MWMPRALRSGLERACRNFSFTAHLPPEYGSRPIHVSAGNQLGVLRPGRAKFERYLFEFVERFIRPGDVVWDVGTNMGFFTLPAAHVGATVVSFEPDPFNQRLLAGTIRDNPDLDITLVPIALADTVGKGALRIPTRGRSANSLVGASEGTDMGGVREIIAVDTGTLDAALEHHPAPSFIKCDAEGAEGMILRGGPRMLNEVRPVIEIELNVANGPECKALLGGANYLLFDALRPIDRPLPDEEVPWEVIAVPAEKVELYRGR